MGLHESFVPFSVLAMWYTDERLKVAYLLWFLGSNCRGLQLGQQGQRVAIYYRVSTDDQSCERQERDLCAFATRAGYDIVGVFMEKA